MQSVQLRLPYPPSLNTYWRHVGPRVLISRKGREYREAVALACMAQGRPHIDGRLIVTVDAYPPDRRVRDLDNMLKGVLDALHHAGLYDDDGQIDELTIRRGAVTEGGLLVVHVAVSAGAPV